MLTFTTRKLKMERDERVIETRSTTAELQRIRSVHAELIQFVQNRKQSEEFLNETIRHEVLRLFNEVLSLSK